jgi:hypothetical protein
MALDYLAAYRSLSDADAPHLRLIMGEKGSPALSAS